jgi:hypothetical protein
VRGIGALASAVVLLATACTTGLAEAEAIAAARRYVSDDRAPVLEGQFAEVFAALANRPIYLQQPSPDEVAGDRRVWGIQFRVTFELCGPSGGVCETRDGIRTIVIDSWTGEWLRSTTHAP